jgi:long-chain acyl-CoA synthetase
MFDKVRLAISTAMPLPSDLARSFQEKFGLRLSPAYGIIEVGLPCVLLPSDEYREGSVGRPGPDYEVKLHGEDGGVGEILVRGKGMFSAYLSPWRLRENLDADGWFHTGDLGRIDGDGFVYIDGRDAEVINFAGMKIFAAEVEGILNEYPSVAESFVYGAADPVYGQVPVGRVVCTTVPLDVRALRRFCYARLSAYKVPKRFEVVERLDYTSSGKLRRSIP